MNWRIIWIDHNNIRHHRMFNDVVQANNFKNSLKSQGYRVQISLIEDESPA